MLSNSQVHNLSCVFRTTEGEVSQSSLHKDKTRRDTNTPEILFPCIRSKTQQYSRQVGNTHTHTRTERSITIRQDPDGCGPLGADHERGQRETGSKQPQKQEATPTTCTCPSAEAGYTLSMRTRGFDGRARSETT